MICIPLGDKSNKRKIIILFVSMLLFKGGLDISYWMVLTRDTVSYVKDFSLLKYLESLLWCVFLFFGIRHQDQKVSTIFLYFSYMIQILPISTIYALGNANTAYYYTICFGFLICEGIVGYTKTNPGFHRNGQISRLMCWLFFVIAVIVLAVIIIQNGMPTLTALDIFNVYELRKSGSFKMGKYMGYMLTWTVKVILPMAITVFLLRKRYVLSSLLCGLIFLLYLYTGHKTYLFSIPLVVAFTLWAQRKNAYWEIFTCAQMGFSALSVLTCIFPNDKGVVYRIYSLFVRRAMILSANNKFIYYDYFSNNPKLKFAGMFPSWLVDVSNPYAGISYPNEIGRIYYDAPKMYVNTGFLAEGFMRFGHLGTLLVCVIFALLLKQTDKLQNRTSFALAVGIFVYPVFGLADAHLLDSLFFGPWMILVVILLFYTWPVENRGIKQ